MTTKPTSRKQPAKSKAATQKKTKAVPRKPVLDDTAQVNEFMKNLEHPFKAEIEAVRSIILKANKKLSERIKWKVPSFYYKHRDMAAFHPRAKELVHVVFVFPPGTMVKESHGLLEGDYKDRRMAKFYGMADVKKKKKALEHIVNQWVELVEQE